MCTAKCSEGSLSLPLEQEAKLTKYIKIGYNLELKDSGGRLRSLRKKAKASNKVLLI